MSQKLFHRRDDSGELGVFEAANYFNDYEVSFSDNNQIIVNDGGCHSQAASSNGERMSTDTLFPAGSQHSSTESEIEKPIALKEKCKQPSSPGGKLACFLNSLFSQTNSSKKKNDKSKTRMNKDEEDNAHIRAGSLRKKRRSSSSSSSEEDEVYSANTTFKINAPFPYNPKIPSSKDDEDDDGDDHRPAGYKFMFSCGISEIRRKSVHWAGECKAEKYDDNNKCSKFDDDCEDDEDDDYHSDSSSDLFDLPISEVLGYYTSTGLPAVYKTAQVDYIKRGAPISATTVI
ncbi:unnamed protein product [Cuscuta epithymum]|uniref:Uncharacterized protein n=1 Tax=Cuscuta epithymum TaxID=186058 RepID=A0AAV0E2N0_9ASTE|nr:unnamed protein product [Cuscuta epithymum]